MSNYTRWYRDGTLNATEGSTAITGSGTYWESAGLNPGDMLEVNNSGLFYEIASINSDTSITLARAYQGATVTGAAYAIVRNFTATMPSKVAAQTAELLHDFKKYIETDMERLTGRSAYEIAKMHGFVGTEAEWLESLKGAGEISAVKETLNSVRDLTINYMSHNTHCDYHNLGSQITAAQLNAIKGGGFADIYPGTNWVFNVSDSLTLIARVMGCNLLKWKGWGEGYIEKNHVVLAIYNYKAAINDTDDCSGGLVNSKLYTEVFPELLELLYNYIPSECFIGIHEVIPDAVNADGTVAHTVGSVEKMLLPSPFNLWGWTDSREFYQFVHRVRWPFLFYYPEFLRWAHIPLNCAVSSTRWGAAVSQGAGYVSSRQPTLSNYIMPYVIIGPQD